MKKAEVTARAVPSPVPAASLPEKKPVYRFVIVPKVVHPWFDLVHEGARSAAKMLEEWTGSKFVIEYRAPQKANVAEQNKILEEAIATRADGITIDLLDDKANRPLLEAALQQGIKVTVFDSLPPAGMELTSIGNDYCEQARIAAERLVQLIGGKGEVAIMKGVPTAPNHAIRAQCHEEVFRKYAEVRLVASGIDNDDIETAKVQAAAIMREHPELKGWVSCDAAGPIGVGRAIKDAGKVGTVQSVGIDDLPEMVEQIREGVADSSSATKPRMQGYWTVIALWQATTGVTMPKRIDTGIQIVTNKMPADYQGY